MRIEVTGTHIATGRRANNRACPLAIAIAEAIGGPVSVEDSCVCFDCENDIDGDGFPRTLPNEAVRFYRAFDAGDEVAPFHFDLDL